ncbi:uncharacterized protein LOC127858726 isoform X2 [Dreissena polymorpha]|uniref:uncharacterized protein LOC127858726 isoform X2 n=1 Tax=Dreissena polymorpha TaxID=45954 RepID=UPI0022651202|nr:uncharacterized protein LOC127858726 isoform X2 [Dreissena polymorpha]
MDSEKANEGEKIWLRRSAATMSYLYMAPCPPPFLSANEFQQHAYSRNLSTDIVLALMVICHIPPDLSTTESTTSYRPTTPSDVKPTTQSNRPSSTPYVLTTVSWIFITTTDNSAPTEKLTWIILIVIFMAMAVAALVFRQKRKESRLDLSTQDHNDSSDVVTSTTSERSQYNGNESSGIRRYSINTIENLTVEKTNSSIEKPPGHTGLDHVTNTNEDSTETKDTTCKYVETTHF